MKKHAVNPASAGHHEKTGVILHHRQLVQLLPGGDETFLVRHGSGCLFVIDRQPAKACGGRDEGEEGLCSESKGKGYRMEKLSIYLRL